jgi:hypothetical protein
MKKSVFLFKGSISYHKGYNQTYTESMDWNEFSSLEDFLIFFLASITESEKEAYIRKCIFNKKLGRWEISVESEAENYDIDDWSEDNLKTAEEILDGFFEMMYRLLNWNLISFNFKVEQEYYDVKEYEKLVEETNRKNEERKAQLEEEKKKYALSR